MSFGEDWPPRRDGGGAEEEYGPTQVPARRRRTTGAGAGAKGGRRALGIATYALTCMAAAGVLFASGSTYFLVNDLKGSSDAIGKDAPHSKGDDVNILLIGLDSRKDNDGNDLPDDILNKLHAGSKRGVDNGVGGYNTNTLILMHVPGDGSKATAFSIPRDDYVTYSDAIGPQQHGKIKEAYGVTKAFKEDALSAKGVKGVALDHAGREAGRKATISTVRALTGVPIDHFAEVNLGGFYDLAQTLGGVDVCLNHATKDSYSGADFPAGVQHLNASQALAFVRQRHNLPNGDLDRTHRQQAFLSSVTHKLKSDGVFGNLGRMQSLLQVAKKDVVMDKGWDLLQFASQAQSLTGGNVEFRTLPIKGYGLINRQDVNLIDPAAIKATVQAAFSDNGSSDVGSGGSKPSPTALAATVDVTNESGHPGLAGQVSDALVSGGYTKGTVGTGTSQRTKTAVRYGSGADAAANKIAALFGTTAVADSSIQDGHVQVDVGRLTTKPPSVSGGGTPAKSTQPVSAPTQDPNAGPESGKAGSAVKGGGVPCVN